MQRFIIVLSFLTLQYSLLAQERELVSVSYGLSGLSYNDTAAHSQLIDIKLRLPLYLKGKSAFGGTVGYRNLSLHHFPEEYSSPLHGIQGQAAWLYKFTQRRNLTVFVQAGLFSDMKDVSKKDFRYGAGFRYRFRHSDRLSTGWGLAYARQFFGNQVIPFIDIDYSPNQKWTLSGQIPVKPQLYYHINKRISTGIELSGEAASFRLSEKDRSNQFLQVNQWTGLFSVACVAAQHWQIKLGAGWNFRQSYRLYEDVSSASWTLITIPLRQKADPIQKIDRSGANIQLSLSYKPFQ